VRVGQGLHQLEFGFGVAVDKRQNDRIKIEASERQQNFTKMSKICKSEIEQGPRRTIQSAFSEAALKAARSSLTIPIMALVVRIAASLSDPPRISGMKLG
jgi:ABC-type uncharacterized transport system substrate-binding protein